MALRYRPKRPSPGPRHTRNPRYSGPPRDCDSRMTKGAWRISKSGPILAAVGRWGMALFMLIWGIGVSFGDNFVRPLLVSRHAQVSTLTVFIGVLGGATAFGAIGLIVGPLVLTLAKALLDYVDERFVPPA